jgi:two-component system sensor histidine kinase/response regulator
MPRIQLIMQNPALSNERYDELLALMEGDRDLLQELIGVFLEDAPQRIEAVRRALADRDAEALYRAGHALKGSAGNFGAPNVVSRAVRGARE